MDYTEEELDYPTHGTCSKEVVRRAQGRLLEIACTVRDILDEGGIPYFIAFGTLIGALRHEGFIPWDLDFDMFVEDSDYDRAMSLVKERIPPSMVVQDCESDPAYCAFWSKVVDRGSELHSTRYASDNSFKYKGLHVDVYRLKRCDAAELPERIVEENVAYYERKRDKGLMTGAEVEVKIAAARASRAKLSARGDGQRCYFLNYMDAPLSCVYPLSECKYENETFMAPRDPMAFLSCCYYKGDVMELPAYGERDTKCDGILFSEG